ncbi:Uncharacterised protein [Mycobacteroides abscessus]|nr:Uncharacterised protein [Mycobacteroides abscessus]
MTRASPHHSDDSTPYPTTTRTTPSSTRLPTTVSRASPHCPPNTTGRRAGTSTKNASSGTPTD